MSQKSESTDVPVTPAKKKRAMPDVFIILFGFMVLVLIASYIVPAGTYERTVENGLTQVDTESFRYITGDTLSVMDLFTAMHNGLVAASTLIFLILIVGGVLKVIETTGAISSGIHRLIALAKGRQNVLIWIFCTTFATLASIGVGANLAIAFIPIGLYLARSMKLDPVVGVAIIFLGSYAGFGAGVFDPTVTVTGQTIAELPLFSGFVYRGAIFIVFLAVTALYICRYAGRIKRDPRASVMGSEALTAAYDSEHNDEHHAFTLTHKLVLALFVLGFGFFIFGAFRYGWSIPQLSATFLMMGVATAVIARISPNEFIRRLMSGAGEVLYGALVIGVAAAVIVLLRQAQLIDTIVHSVASSLDGHGKVMAMELLYGFNLLFNGLITSGTGQAAIVMPIMVPIGDMLEVTRQATFITFKLGDAVTNIVTPLSGTLMACLAIARVSYIEWFRFVLPLVLLWIVIGGAFVGVAVAINYGPF
ncbi:YfcC family protein [Halomonas sp. HNIBRBA4712]|uniref:YfcC family protein n=1 Tax=Halomonas sp. HNIBRBA4712 TaxID=3373087 RepID=UPI003745B1E5